MTLFVKLTVYFKFKTIGMNPRASFGLKFSSELCGI